MSFAQTWEMTSFVWVFYCFPVFRGKDGLGGFRAPARGTLLTELSLRGFRAPARPTFLIKEKWAKVDSGASPLKTPSGADRGCGPLWDYRVHSPRQPRWKPGTDWLSCIRPSRFAAGFRGGAVGMTFLSVFYHTSHKKSIEKPSGHFQRSSALKRVYRTQINT